jgi:hypothetical protein
MELGQTNDLEQLLLGGPDPLFFDYLDGVLDRREPTAQGVAAPSATPSASLGLRCLDSTHEANCTMCVPTSWA